MTKCALTLNGVFFAGGHWLGWGAVCSFLYAVDCLGAIGVSSLPIVVVLLGLSVKAKEHLGKVLVVAGSMLVLHLVFTACLVELVLREPFVLDLNPFDRVMSWTLNWSVPAAAAGLLIGIAFGRRMLRCPLYRIGATLTAGASLAFVWYGHYFFVVVVGSTLAENVWWL